MVYAASGLMRCSASWYSAVLPPRSSVVSCTHVHYWGRVSLEYFHGTTAMLNPFDEVRRMNDQEADNER